MTIQSLRNLLLGCALGWILSAPPALARESSETFSGDETPAIVLVAETALGGGEEFELQEEYEQLGHLRAIRTAVTTPTGGVNFDIYGRILNDNPVDVWVVNLEIEVGLAERFDVQAGIELFRSEDLGLTEESGLGRPYAEATYIFHIDEGRGQRMGAGLRLDLPPIDSDLLMSGDEFILEPFFVLNQELGQFTMFLDLGMSLQSGNSHLNVGLGTRVHAAENSALFRGPLDLLLGFTLEIGDNSIFAITPALEAAPSWLPGNFSAGITIGVTGDAFDWGLVAGTDFRF